MPDIEIVASSLGPEGPYKPLFNDRNIRIGICEIDAKAEDIFRAIGIDVCKRTRNGQVIKSKASIKEKRVVAKIQDKLSYKSIYVIDGPDWGRRSIAGQAKTDLGFVLNSYQTYQFKDPDAEMNGDIDDSDIVPSFSDILELHGNLVFPLMSDRENLVVGIAEFAFPVRGGLAQAYVGTVNDVVMTAVASVHIDERNQIVRLPDNWQQFREPLYGADIVQIRSLLDRVAAVPVAIGEEDGYPVSAAVRPQSPGPAPGAEGVASS